jgi:hypothetical protein
LPRGSSASKRIGDVAWRTEGRIVPFARTSAGALEEIEVVLAKAAARRSSSHATPSRRKTRRGNSTQRRATS